jgi:hypothetical protein
MSLPAIKYRAFSFASKYISSIVLPIAIAKSYGSVVNGDVQLLIAATAYLGLLDSGMSISALNRSAMQSGDPQDNARNTLRLQLRSSIKIFLIGIFISGTLLFAAVWNHLLSTSLLLCGSFLALATIFEIAVTPFKYHLYSYGLARSVEKREAFLSAIFTLTLLACSMLIFLGKLSLILALPLGLVLLRADRVASGLASLRDLQLFAKLSVNNDCFLYAKKAPCSTQSVYNDDRRNRFWISALQALALLNWSADIFLIKLIVGAAAVSDYSIYSKFFMLPVAIAALANPVIQSAVSQGRLNYSRFVLIFKTSWPIILVATTLIVLFSERIVSALPWLSIRIGLSTNPSIYLITSFCYLSVLSTISGFYAPVANGLQLFRYQVIVSTIFLPSNVFFSWLLGSRSGFGMVGILAGTCLTMTITSCIMVPKEILKRLKDLQIQPGMIRNS